MTRCFSASSTTRGSCWPASPIFHSPDFATDGRRCRQWYDTQWQGQKLRAVITRRAMYDVAGSRQITVIVGKTTHSRDNMVRALWWPTMEYLLWALVVAVLVSATALTLELRPCCARRASYRAARCSRTRYGFSPRLDPAAPGTASAGRDRQPVCTHHTQPGHAPAPVHLRCGPPAAHAAGQAHTLQQLQQLSPDEQPQQSALVQRLQRSNQQLISTTNQLLTLAQAEQADSTQMQTVDLRELCLQALQTLPRRPSKKPGPGTGRWRCTAPYLALHTSNRLPELIHNLLDNAIRYTPAHGQVTLGLQSTADSITLYVEDNGPGIPRQSHDKVFERFYRLGSDQPGTGLGLAIVQEVARASQARITLGPALQTTSTPQRPGLRVEVVFPRSA